MSSTDSGEEFIDGMTTPPSRITPEPFIEFMSYCDHPASIGPSDNPACSELRFPVKKDKKKKDLTPNSTQASVKIDTSHLEIKVRRDTLIASRQYCTANIKIQVR